MEAYGALSLVPAATVLLLALFTKRTLESLIGDALVGFLILNGTSFFSGFADSTLKVMADPTIGWIIMVCGLFGSLIALLVKSDGAVAFGNWLSRYVRGKKSSLIATWFLGLIVFIDDYLNALTVSSAMKKVTDKFKVSREMLAYVVDSTAAPVCVLVPFSTWAIFVSGLLEESGAAPQGEGLALYMQSVPSMIYAWITVFIVPLVAMQIVPRLGRMRKAERRAEAGQPQPDPSAQLAELSAEVAQRAEENPRLWNFIVPIVLLIGATWYFDVDAFKGVLVGTTAAVILYSVQRIMTLNEIFDTMLDGFKTMMLPLGIVVASFILKEANDGLGLTQYVIGVAQPFMSAAFLPVVAFLGLSLVTFATGSFWGVYAVALPIVVPLAVAMDANLPLTIGAVVSAGAFGSHACFYGDSTVLCATGSGVTSMDHAITQIPYAVLTAALSAFGFIAAVLMLTAG